ncbi:MAG: hypothetical protein ACRCZ9_05580 [Fusobacteriaceae bacterium]
MTRFFLSDKDELFMETTSFFKGEEDRCVLYACRTGFAGSNFIVLKGVDSEIIKDVEDTNVKEIDMVLDACFDKELNDRIKNIVEYCSEVINIDCSKEHPEDYEYESDNTTKMVINEFVKEMENIGIKMYNKYIYEILEGGGQNEY